MGKDILVTGAYGGMGRAVVRALRAEGYRVFALDRRVGEAEDGVIPIAADLTSEEAVQAASERVREHTDSLAGVLHFAGIYQLDSLVEMDTEDFCRIFAVNVQAAFLVNKAFLPLLERGGRIMITTSELAPLDPLPFTGIYAVTKSALDKYAYSLRMELQLLDISISVLRAGAVQTDMLGDSTAALDRFCEKTALYTCNADRFKAIVERVEARCIPPEKLAKKVLRILKKKKPAFVYSINRNPLLLLLNLLPKRLQFWAIRLVLSSETSRQRVPKEGQLRREISENNK
ncbi:MAG: SDR family NAD(P)-dependent oxidoreductase [Clostridia bacterium]|nr:SDR family NAD(P)-dependent oxidoreductase [Clostridia bacterium]